MAQQRAQTAEQKAESAFSSVGVVADQVHRVQSVAEVAIAEARSVRDEISSRMVEFVKRADDTASSTLGILMGKMTEVTTQTKAQMLRTAKEVKQ